MRLACFGDSIANLDEETLATLKAKHPFPHPDMQIPPLVEGFTLSTPVSEEVVAKAILFFPNGLAGGPDGLRPQHLKDLTSAEGPHQCVGGEGRQGASPGPSHLCQPGIEG